MNKPLTQREAMQALLDGKKLKRKYWISGEYIYVNNAGDIVVDSGYSPVNRVIDSLKGFYLVSE